VGTDAPEQISFVRAGCPPAASSPLGELQAVTSPPQFLRRKRGVSVASHFGDLSGSRHCRLPTAVDVPAARKSYWFRRLGAVKVV
jgi:hypothetical protein